MDVFAERVVQVLEPFVGRIVADTCVRASALAAGVTSDTLGPEHMPSLEGSVRRLLTPVAPQATIDQLLSGIREEASR